jgi:hypothetical protein
VWGVRGLYVGHALIEGPPLLWKMRDSETMNPRGANQYTLNQLAANLYTLTKSTCIKPTIHAWPT